jgi:SOS-response transcriptional repressor LexA
MLLDRVVNDLGTKTALARELGIKVQTLVGWWSRGIPRHAAARVRLLVEDKPRAGSRQDDSPFMEVPLVGTAAGGPPSKRHAQMRRVPAYAPWAKKTDRCVRVVGDSMSPQFNDGDFVGIRKWTRPLEELRGKFVVVTLPKQGAVVRRLNLSKKFIILGSLDRNDPDIYVERGRPPEIWRVEWWHGHQR